MPRKVEKLVNTCKECPYCHFESEIGEHFCLNDPNEPEASAWLALDEEMNIATGIHSSCPLPWVEDKVVLTPVYSCGALQVQELDECPEEWIEQILADEVAYDERRRRDVDRDVEKMFEGFDENDESWDHQK